MFQSVVLSVPDTTYFGESFAEQGAGVVLGGPARPRRREHLERAASEQQRLARSHDPADRHSHVRVEPVYSIVEAGLVDHSVQRRELVHHDLTHVDLP